MTGSISGSGFASAKTIEPLAIPAISASVKTFGALTPINTSAPFIASEILPEKPAVTQPSLSKAIIFVAPLLVNNRATAVPAAPAPLITIVASPNFLPTNFSELVSAASTTIAVPC